jgi:hypothetical protein
MRLSQFRELVANMPVSDQASTSKRSTWAKYIDGGGAAGNALRSIFGVRNEVKLSRLDLRGFASNSDLAQFAMATIIWGYTSGMRGNNVPKLIPHVDRLTQLLAEARAQPVTDWSTHYDEVKRIPGIGLSTYTKFLNFLSVRVHDHTALILDNTIIRIANQGVFEELAPLQELKISNAARFYAEYLTCMHAVASDLAVPAEAIEFFLFLFGLNLKPPGRK